jgi:Spy/CpxP family protein refolding chaperone
MKRSSRLGAVLVTIACALAPAAADADHGGREGRSGKEGRRFCGDQFAQAVGLTEEQKASLATLRQQAGESAKPLGEQARAYRRQMHEMLESANPDAAAVGRLAIQARDIHKQIRASFEKAESDFVAALSADQKSKYETFREANPRCGVFGRGKAGRGMGRERGRAF